MKDWITIIEILSIAVTVIIIVLHALGPTKNKATIDESIRALREHFPKRPPDHRPDPDLFAAFANDCTNTMLLTGLAREILRHCGMRPENLTVTTKHEAVYHHAAGTYSSDGMHSTITIHVTPNARYNVIYSVLIHECMHYFLFRSGLRFEDVYQNEILTDTAAVYMGFFSFMYNGYVMVGYLRDSDLKYINERL